LLLFFAPIQPLDVAKLQPVQTVAVYTRGEYVFLETDTGTTGRGENVADALEDLEKATPGVIYLDTSEYLLVSESAVPLVNDLRSYLHPAVKVCMWDEKGGVKDASKYLAVMENLPDLQHWKAPKKKVEK
jgi:hypothetical protein